MAKRKRNTEAYSPDLPGSDIDIHGAPAVIPDEPTQEEVAHVKLDAIGIKPAAIIADIEQMIAELEKMDKASDGDRYAIAVRYLQNAVIYVKAGK